MKSVLMALLSSILLVLSFPKFDFALLAWLAFIPLILTLQGKSLVKSFFLALFCGGLFWAGLVYWLLNVPRYTLLHYVILMPYLGLGFGLFGLLFSFILQRRGILAAHISAPFIWIALEFAKSHFFWLALPWGLLAHSQYQYLELIQIASWTGAYGVSFLVVAVNSTLALVIQTLYRRRKSSIASGPGVPSWSAVAGLILATAGILAVCLIYGQAVLAKPLEGDPIKISLLQGNIPQEKKWDKESARFIMKTYRDLSLEAAKDNTGR
jgi:apolipoprotein N-acyltransferase